MPEPAAGLRLAILAAERRAVGRDWRFADVVSPFARLYLVHAADRAEVRHDGRTWPLAAGRLHLIPAFARSQYRCLGMLDHTYVHFTAVGDGGIDLTRTGALAAEVAAADHHAGRLARIVAARTQAGDAARLGEEGELRLVLADLAAQAERAARDGALPAAAGDALAAALRHASEHLDQPLTVAALAERAGLHPTWFAERFRQRFGCTPRAWLIARRLERAAWLLRTTTLRIDAIAAQVGVSDRAYLSRCFARRFGCGPAQYRRTAQPGD